MSIDEEMCFWWSPQMSMTAWPSETIEVNFGRISPSCSTTRPFASETMRIVVDQVAVDCLLAYMLR